MEAVSGRAAEGNMADDSGGLSGLASSLGFSRIRELTPGCNLVPPQALAHKVDGLLCVAALP